MEEGRPARPACVEGLRACRVLVVDDDPIVAAGTAAMLEDLGHSAIEAASAEIALQVLSSVSGIDFVITDHAMPGMTGTELATRIRRNWPELPVALASGYTDLPGNETPDLPRLSKPYCQQDLAAMVARLVARLVVEQPAAPRIAVV